MRALLIPANPTRRVTTIALDPRHPETALTAHLGGSLTSLCQRTGASHLQIWAGPDTTTPNVRANTVLDALAGAADAPATLTGDAIVTGYTADFDTAGLSCAEARALRKATGVHPHPDAAEAPATTR